MSKLLSISILTFNQTCANIRILNNKNKKKANKKMEITSDSIIEPVTVTEVLSLASWDRQRSTDELQGFIAQRSAALGL